jgi:hypothetical protein
MATRLCSRASLLGGLRCRRAPLQNYLRALPNLRLCRTPATCNYRGPDPRRRQQQRGGQPTPLRLDQATLARLALPALGVAAAAVVIGPLIGGLLFAALGAGVAIAAGTVALSFAWVLIPAFVLLFGWPVLIGGGVLAGVTLAGSLLQLGIVGAGLYLGASIARSLLFPAAGGGSNTSGVGPNGTIDVEFESVDDAAWKEEEAEARRREAELREFDELMRRREKFTKGGGGL